MKNSLSPHVRTVIIPCLASDVENFRTLLASWSHPSLFPLLGSCDKKRSLLMVVNNADKDVRNRFRKVFQGFPGIQGVFADFRVESARLTGDRDIYVKTTEKSAGEFGNRAGPNFLFFRALEMAAEQGGFAFQCEMDCLPLRKGWLNELDEIVVHNPDAWVIGSNYYGQYPITHEFRFHINGNAIYHVGDIGFRRFLEDIWKRRLLQVASIYPNLAYDCWWSAELGRASAQVRNSSWMYALAYSHRFVAIPFIMNLLHKETLAEDTSTALELEEMTGSRSIFAHSNFMPELINAYVAGDSDDPLSFFLEVAGKCEEFAKANSEPVDAKEKTEGDLVRINNISSSVEDGYASILTLLSICGTEKQQIHKVNVLFQLLDGQYLVELRLRDNLNVGLRDDIDTSTDTWGPCAKVSTNDLLTRYVDGTAVTFASLGDNVGSELTSSQVFYVIAHNWQNILDSFSSISREVDHMALPEASFDAEPLPFVQSTPDGVGVLGKPKIQSKPELDEFGFVQVQNQQMLWELEVRGREKQKQIEELERKLAQFMSSNSYRLTAPLRRIRALLAGGKLS